MYLIFLLVKYIRILLKWGTMFVSSHSLLAFDFLGALLCVSWIKLLQNLWHTSAPFLGSRSWILQEQFCGKKCIQLFLVLGFFSFFLVWWFLFFPLQLVYSVLSVFYCTAKWPSDTHTHTYTHMHSFSHIILHHVPSHLARQKCPVLYSRILFSRFQKAGSTFKRVLATQHDLAGTVLDLH